MAGDILNIGEFGKPLDRLVDKSSQAIGGALRPWQIKRVAKAEAEAQIIKAKADIKINDIHIRAKNRVETEELLKQRNMELILANAGTHLGTAAKPEEMSNDWLMNYFDKARLISDEDMQEVWARILAEEANKPGAVSKRTINILASMDSREAREFTKLCRMLWIVDTEVAVVLPTINSKGMREAKLSLASISDLDAAGLITISAPTSGYSIGPFEPMGSVSYHGQHYFVEFEDGDEPDLPVGRILLTSSGDELAQICKPDPLGQGYLDEVIDFWQARGVIIHKL